MIPKRFENRELCADLIKVTWTPECELTKTKWTILGDISPSGACLETEEPIPQNTVVTLELGKDRCQARIQYCKYVKANYLLGVKFEDGYRWSIDRWKPEHLVQFRQRKISDKPV